MGEHKWRNQEIGPGVAGSGHEERGEGRKQEKMKFFKRLHGKEKRDSGGAAATEDGTLRR